MNQGDNTLFLRLAGPMQAWGTSSRLQLRRTDTYPSKSGVLGLILCAMGVNREDSSGWLSELSKLVMGVRVDLPGKLEWDYHTVGAKIGIRKAESKPLKLGDESDKNIKRTDATKEIETLLSRRQYLYDASFLVALQGSPDALNTCSHALGEPVWPVFLGRKCCVPAEPVLAGTGNFSALTDALTSVPWRPRIDAIDNKRRSRQRDLDVFIEHSPGTPPPKNAKLVYDVPRKLGFYSHGPRWIIPAQVTVPVGEATQPPPLIQTWIPFDYTHPQWRDIDRPARLGTDNYLCVFCKSPATEVHHVEYPADGRASDQNLLRSLCKLCHDACTMLEYGHNMKRRRIDPAEPSQRLIILEQINKLLDPTRRFRRRQELLGAGRHLGADSL